MKTNKQITLETLNSYFLQSNNTINTSYLNDLLIIELRNNERLYQSYCNTRRKAESIAFEALIVFTNRELEMNGYSEYYASNEQLKDWLFKFGRGYEELKQVIEDIKRNQEEIKEERAGE